MGGPCFRKQDSRVVSGISVAYWHVHVFYRTCFCESSYPSDVVLADEKRYSCTLLKREGCSTTCIRA